MKAAIACVLGLLCARQVARADRTREVPDRARSLGVRGRAAYDAGDYGAAVVAFKAALELAPTPALLFDLAQTYRLGGHCETAAAFYRRFLGTKPDSDARALAERQLASMERCVAELHATSTTDGSSLPPQSGEAGVSVAVPTTRASPVERDVGIGLGIGSGVAFVASIYYAIEAHDAASAVSEAYAHGSSSVVVKDLDAIGRHDATAGQVLGATGLATAGAGALLYFLGGREVTPHPIAVVPNAHGAEVRIRWQF